MRQVVADDRSGLVSSSDLRPAALRIVSEGGRSTVLGTPAAPAPLRQGFWERTMLAVDWQRLAHRRGPPSEAFDAMEPRGADAARGCCLAYPVAAPPGLLVQASGLYLELVSPSPRPVTVAWSHTPAPKLQR